MAQTISAVDVDGNIQYVLNDTSQFILQSSDPDQFGNVICTDGTQAILLNGELIADSSDGDGQTYILQDDDLNQYYIQETDEILVSGENQSSAGFLEAVPTHLNDTSSQSNLIQFVDEEGHFINTGAPNILCIQDETETGEYQLVEGFQAEFDGTQTVQFRANQVVELEDLIQQQGEAAIVQIEGQDNRYQYAILKDGKLHIQCYPEYDNGQDILQVTNDTPTAEWENITGRNLITGKQLSLRSLAEKPQKRGSTKRKQKKKRGLEGLLNKKLDLGRTVNGKKLVGKIIQIGKRQQEGQSNKTNEAVVKDEEQENGNPPGVTNSVEATHYLNTSHNVEVTNKFKDISTVQATSTPSGTAFILKRKIISKDVLDQISKTLSGLMKLESVKKKLKNKHLLIKVIERRYVQSKKTFERNFSYTSGYMEDNYLVNQETGDLVQSWSYVPEADRKSEEISEGEAVKKVMFPEVLHLTFLITVQKKGQHVKVVLEPDGSPLKCGTCNKTFKTKELLNIHWTTHHGISLQMKQCEYCAFASATDAEWEEHRKYHDGQQVMGCVEEGCEASFSTLEKLSKHAEVHRKNTKGCFKCRNCPYESVNAKEFSNHLLTSHGIGNDSHLTIDERANKKDQRSKQAKNYACEMCQRTFSRYSNLMRHVGIHVGHDMYSCSICGSAYHYVSSLTRHIVQNHVKI